MLQLAVDFPSCESLGPGPEFRLLPRPPQRPPRPWSLRSGQPSRLPAPVWSPRAPRAERAHGQMQAPRARRAHRPRDQVAALVPRGGLAKPPAAAKSSPSLTSSSSSSSSAVAGGAPEQQSLLRRGKRHAQDSGLGSFELRGGRPTTETEFIAWGPTGDEEAPEANTFPGVYGPTTVPILQTRKTTVATTTIAATTATSMTLQTRGVTASPDPRRRVPAGASTTEPSPSPSNSGKDSKPPRILGETSGRRHHACGSVWGPGVERLGAREAEGRVVHGARLNRRRPGSGRTCGRDGVRCRDQAHPPARRGGSARLGKRVHVKRGLPSCRPPRAAGGKGGGGVFRNLQG